MRYLVFLVLILAYPASLFAYTDHIAVPIEEVWKASEEALKPYGIQKADQSKGVLESKWIQEQVTRESLSLMKKFKFKKDYYRRLRIKILLKQTEYSTRVQITGTYMFRAVDAPWHGVWKKMKLKAEDRLREQDFFYKILSNLEKSRTRLDSVS